MIIKNHDIGWDTNDMNAEKRNHEMYESDSDSEFPSYLFAKFCRHVGVPNSQILWDASRCFFLFWIAAWESFLVIFFSKRKTHLCQKLEVDWQWEQKQLWLPGFYNWRISEEKQKWVGFRMLSLLLCMNVCSLTNEEGRSHQLINIYKYLFYRVYCPRNCMQANPHYARVIGTRVYSDVSILIHAALSIRVHIYV